MRKETPKSSSFHTIDPDDPFSLVGKFLYFIFIVFNSMINSSNKVAFEIRGASQSLAISKYVTTDLRPKRGIGKTRMRENPVTIIVSERSQEIVRFPGGRETCLFRNKNFNI